MPLVIESLYAQMLIPVTIEFIPKFLRAKKTPLSCSSRRFKNVPEQARSVNQNLNEVHHLVACVCVCETVRKCKSARCTRSEPSPAIAYLFSLCQSINIPFIILKPSFKATTLLTFPPLLCPIRL